MASLDSDQVRSALKAKLKCEEQKDSDHYRYILRDSDGKILSRTMISLGPKHTIGDTIVNKMAHQIKLGTTKNFVEMVQCSLSAEECLKIIRSATR